MPRIIPLEGKTFGSLHVEKKYGKENGYITWLCKCSCGKEVVYPSYKINGGEVLDCGCGAFKDKTMGKLTIVEDRGDTLFCVCSCGSYITVYKQRLNTRKDCGCGCG